MQAARGASLSDDAETRPDRADGRPLRPKLLLAGVALVVYGIDLATKHFAVTRLVDGDIPVLGDWFVLHLTFNPGAAFSLGTDFTVALTCLAITAVVVVLWVGRRVGSPLWGVALGLLLGGVAGNLTDRLFRDPGPMRGHVVDLFMIPNWPVFNIADICINVAAGLIVLQAVRGITVDGRREASTP